MQVDAATQARALQAFGMAPITTPVAFQSLYSALEFDRPHIMVLFGRAARIQQWLHPLVPVTAHDTLAVLRQPVPTSVDPTTDDVAERVEAELVRTVSSLLKISQDIIDVNSELNEFGLDSITLTSLGNALNKKYGLDLTPTVFFQYPTLRELARYLAQEKGNAFLHTDAPLMRATAPQSLPQAAQQLPPAYAVPRFAGHTQSSLAPTTVASRLRHAAEPIAIIGINGAFPESSNLDILWDNLAAGRDCIREIPESRWNHSMYFSAVKGTPGKSHCKWGGFIEGVDQFDPLFFNISPRDAHTMDPQERKFLETVWTLLEKGGHTRATLQKQYQGKIGVYVGAMYKHYKVGQVDQNLDAVLSLTSYSAIANRVSYFFGFEGPSIAVDTMCSSSALAIHLACKDLQHGDCKLAIAGGVNLSIHPNKYVGLSQAQVIGSHANSRSFGNGDGFIPAEGVGAVLLKPLADAIADKDPILAIIRGSATNHSGRSNGYQAPNLNAQKALIQDVLRRADATPESVSYIEAAANGSALGDSIEVAALTEVFGKERQGSAWCALGSVKSNIGHPEAASGIAQLAKVVFQMKYGQFAPSIKTEPLNPHLRLEKTPFKLHTELAEWSRLTIAADGAQREVPRRALINSFGAGGTNVSLLVEEYLSPNQQYSSSETDQEPRQVFVFSAKTEERLHAVAAQMLAYFEQHDKLALPDLAYTLQVGREAMEWRLALLAPDQAGLIAGLHAYLEHGNKNGNHAVTIIAGNTDEQHNHLKQLVSGRAGESLANAMIASRDLEKLALYWVNGGSVPWEALHVNHSVRKIALPTYPFVQQQYWMMQIGGDRADQSIATAQAALPSIVPVLTVHNGKQLERQSVEQVLRRLVSELLGTPGSVLLPERALQSFGFRSIDALALKHKIEQTFECELPLALLGQGELTISALAHHLDTLVARTTAPGTTLESSLTIGSVTSPVTCSQRVPDIVGRPDERHVTFPLSDIQEAFLVGRKLGFINDLSGAHIYLELEAPDNLDIYRLNQAWQRVIERHDMLRCTINEDNQQVIQREVRPFRIKVADLRRLSPDVYEGRFDNLRELMSHQVGTPGQWPMFDIRVSIHPGKQRFIHFWIDELIADASSLMVLLKDWAFLYSRPDASLPVMTLTFRDYVLAMKAFERSERYKRDLQYWSTRMKNLPSGPQLPRATYPLENGHRAKRVRLTGTLAASDWSTLKAQAAAWQVSPTALILSIFAEALRACSETKRFALVMTYLNRPPLHEQINEMVGTAISTNIFIAESNTTDDFREIARSHQTALMRDLDYAAVSGVRALRELRASGNVPAELSLPVVFTSLLTSITPEVADGWFGDVFYMENHTPQVFLDHQVREQAGSLLISWDVADGYYAEGLLQALFNAFINVLRSLAARSLSWSAGAICAAITDATNQQSMRTLQQDANRPPEGFFVQIGQGDAGDEFALSDQQQAYAFGRSQQSPRAAGSCQVYQEIDVERLDLVRFEQAWNALLHMHPMLVTTIRPDGRQQRLTTVPSYAIATRDMVGMDVPGRELALQEVRRVMVARVVRLGEWPYFELRVSWLNDKHARIHLCVDMLIADGCSIRHLLVQLFSLYHEPHTIKTAPSITFRDYQMAVDRFKGTSAYETSKQYWSNKFQRLPGGPRLPVRTIGRPLADAEHHRTSVMLDTWNSIQTHARTLQVRSSTVLLTAYLEVLYAWNAEEPLSVVVPTWDRLAVHPQVDEVVGDFTALAWVARTNERLPFADRVLAVQRELASDLNQRPVSGLSVLRRIALKQANNALAFPAVFTDQLPVVELPGEDVRLGYALSKTPQVYLDNISIEEGNRLFCAWDYAADIYPAAMIQDMFAGYTRVLTLLCDDTTAWSSDDFSDVIHAEPQKYRAQSNENEEEGIA